MILSVKDVRKSYPGFELNCSLEVDRGRITGLIGQNGAGKTTLFKIILGLVFAEGGEVTLFDENISSLS
ncbi:MAG: ATP-binding cassette domain-containing protein, partial [Solobacterium sp.]|nr:ATP-binding cassette domain-containing protein [Solobacterium sp.]